MIWSDFYDDIVVIINFPAAAGLLLLIFFFVSLRSVSYNLGYATIQVAFVWEEEEGWGGGGGGGSWMINYANDFGGSTFFLHLEWGGSPQNW